MPAILLVRHEEPELRGRFIGRTDPPLTAAGRQAAREKLSALEAGVIYVSPLRRALETADAIRCAAPRIVLPELAEIDFGEWEGLTWSEIEQRWPGTAARKVEDWMGVPTPGGEAWPDFHARVNRALDRVLAGPLPAIVVAHMVVNAVLAERLLGADPRHFHQPYGDVIRYEHNSGDSLLREPRAGEADR